jgi:hypothetical protein
MIMALRDDINAVNAWANYVAATPVGKLHPRSTEDRALRTAGLKVLWAAQDWPEVSRTDEQHLTLRAPDGTLVQYIYRQEGEQFVERLSIADEL